MTTQDNCKNEGNNVNGKVFFEQSIPGKELFSSLLYPCGEVWEFIEYFADSEGKYPFTFSRNTEPPEFKEDGRESEYSEVCAGALNELTGEGEKAGGLSEEEKEAERLRYIQKQKKEIRRLINANQLYFMFTLTFAVRESKNVQGLRFTDMMDSDKQRDRTQVLKIWNTRLTAIRRALKEIGEVFKFVLVLERHEGKNTSAEKYGTYHLHLATNVNIDKHLLQRLWGYGVVWIDDFTKEKVFEQGKWKNVDSQVDVVFRENPGQYMSKYMDKEVGNVDFLCKHAYSSSRNLARPESLKRRDRKEQRTLFQNPLKELERQGILLEEEQFQKIRELENIEQVKVFDTLEARGELIKVEFVVEEEVRTIYLRMRVYNFRILRKGGERRANRRVSKTV